MIVALYLTGSMSDAIENIQNSLSYLVSIIKNEVYQIKDKIIETLSRKLNAPDLDEINELAKSIRSEMLLKFGW